MTFTGIPLMRFAVTFVCSGNTCRSAMAAAVLESLLAGSPVAEQVVVDSYGTGDWHVGEPADPRALAVLAEHGLDASAHRARVIPADLLSRSDLILCAEARHRRRVCRLGVAGPGQVRLIREFDPRSMAAGELDLKDPYEGSLDDYRACFVDVTAACAGLMAALPGLLGNSAGHRGSQW